MSLSTEERIQKEDHALIAWCKLREDRFSQIEKHIESPIDRLEFRSLVAAAFNGGLRAGRILEQQENE